MFLIIFLEILIGIQKTYVPHNKVIKLSDCYRFYFIQLSDEIYNYIIQILKLIEKYLCIKLWEKFTLKYI